MEASGKPASKIVQAALKKYFHPENRGAAVEEVIRSALVIGKSDGLDEAIDEWKRDREQDRW